ncbi:MAG: FAD-dependent oxidoreductase [Chloroflexota bacterium]|nr:FAD-dependent oxidoreductase [Chloroflexota bacterium]
MAPKYTFSSHENFSHDDIDSFGYDWERNANRDIAPKYPLKVYLPRTTEDVVEVMREARRLGQELKIRSMGHSSNDLVLTERGAVLCTQKMDRILDFNEDELSVTVQAGAITADMDRYLIARGYGLPVIGDHHDITAGGFASVGGFNPASLRHGIFIDNVLRLEAVTWEGEVVRCSKAENREQFYRFLAGTGRYGMITELTCRVIRVRKTRDLVRNDQTNYRNLDEYLAATTRFIEDSGDAVMQRLVWFDFGRFLKMGQLSAYTPTPRTFSHALRDWAVYKYLHTLGYWAGRLPKAVDLMVKNVAILHVMFPPRYSTIKHAESLTDRVLESSVGDPTRMLAVIAPVDQYEPMFRGMYKLLRDYRKRYKCFSFLTLYVKALKSEYLEGLSPGKRFCEVMMYLGVKPEGMTNEVMERLVSELDDLCIEHGAFRYMHTKTVKDPERRRKIDPNEVYNREAAPSRELEGAPT